MEDSDSGEEIFYYAKHFQQGSQRVCRLWSETVKQIKRRRKTRSWTFHKCEDDFSRESIQTYIQGLYTEPSLFIMFGQKKLINSPIRIQSNDSPMEFSLGEIVKGLLPTACSFVGLSADGVVGTSTDLKTSYEFEGKKGISFMALPKYEGVDIYTFTTDIYMFYYVDNAEFSTIHTDKNPKAILFFCEDPVAAPEEHIGGHSLLHLYPDSVIAGAYVDNVAIVQPVECLYDHTGDVPPPVLCVAFCGDNVNVASVVIDRDVNNEVEVEKQIIQLKTCNFSEERSFAFMFASVDRGFRLYGKETVESSIFRKFFPKTPLIGFFGNEEVGCTHLPGQNNGGEPRSKNRKSLYHEFKTVFCVITVT